ncbi:C1 family peptidase [Roseomonas mucosa]
MSEITSEKEAEFFKKVGGIPLIQGDGEAKWFFGWIQRDPLVEQYLKKAKLNLFSASGSQLSNSGAGKTVLLYEAVRKVWNTDLDTGPQLIGDCVSWGYGGCVDLIACIEILSGEAEEYSYDLRVSTEVIYALSRVEYGDFDGSPMDGSYGAWAAKAVQQGGTLSRKEIGAYDPQRARTWGASGLPDELEPKAKQHKIRKASLVRHFNEARDAIANGYPVAVCSDQGFSLTRDKDGFAAPQGSWLHCMKFIASNDKERPGLLCMNSWGKTTPSGPKGAIDVPDGSFWVDADICEKMLKQGDSYALSQFDGYPRRLESIISSLGLVS